MAAKFQLELEENVAVGLKTVVNKVNDAFDHLKQDAVDAGNRAADALERIEDHLKDVASEAKTTDGAMEKIGSTGTAGKITAVATSVTALGVGLKLGSEAAKMAMNAINFMADSGSPAAKRLQDAISGVQDALIKLADDPRVQGLADQLAELGDRAAEGIAELPGLWSRAVDGIADAMVQGMEAVGLAAEGTVETLDEMQAAETAALEVAKERIGIERERLIIEKQKTELAKGLKQLEDAAESATRAAALAKVKDQAEIVHMIEEQKTALQAAADAGKLTDDARIAGLRKLTELESRLQGIQREGEAAAEVERAAREVDEKRIADVRAAATLAEQKRIEAIAREKQAQYAEEVKRQQAALTKSGAAGEIAKRASDPEAIAHRLSAERGEQRRAEAEFQGMTPTQVKREVNEATRRAFRQAMQQQRGGREEFSDDEMATAQQVNTDAQLATLRQTGKFSNATIDALGQATQELDRQGQELQQTQDTLDTLKKQLALTSRAGERRRAQRNSNRQ